MPDIDYGQILEALNDKMDRDMHNSQKPYIVETYDDGNGNGYILWSNKWSKQYGQFDTHGGPAGTTITFLKEFADTNYYFNYINSWTGYVENGNSFTFHSMSTTGLTIPWAVSAGDKKGRWEAYGYLSED